MTTIEDYVLKLCEKYPDALLSYQKNGGGDFWYGMADHYTNEILLLFPLNSPQIIGFMDDLFKKYGYDDDYNFKENYGEESGCEYDRLWIWWDAIEN